jgi:cell division protein FtsI/penicillin-binding protein 2
LDIGPLKCGWPALEQFGLDQPWDIGIGQAQPNSWFVAFDPNQDVAVACLVLNAGYGAQFAAPGVLKFLNGY